MLKFPTVSSNTLYVFKSSAELRENKHAEKAFSWPKRGEDSAGIFILLWKQQNFHQRLSADAAKKAFCVKLGLRDTQRASAQLENKTEICSAGRGENDEEKMFYRRVEWWFCSWFFLLGHAGWDDSPVLTAQFRGWVQSQDELREGRRVVSGKHHHE